MQIPLDILAAEWLDTMDASIETRIYMIEKLVPTLVLALERLLGEVEKKNLLDTAELTPDFNPINFVAQYLMRNNPRFNFSEASSYAKSMTLVQQELKDRAYELSGNRLAKLAAEVERRRRLIEDEDHRKLLAWKTHLQALVLKYAEWDDDGTGLHGPTLMAGLRSFAEAAHRHHTVPSTIEADVAAAIKFEQLPVLTHSSESPVNLETLIREVGPILEHCPSGIVDALASHLSVCFGTDSYANIAFSALFNALSPKPIRHKFLVVLQDFYESNKDNTSSVLTRPRALSFSTEAFVGCALGKFVSCSPQLWRLVPCARPKAVHR